MTYFFLHAMKMIMTMMRSTASATATNIRENWSSCSRLLAVTGSTAGWKSKEGTCWDVHHRDLIPKTHSTAQGSHSQNPFYNTGISFPKPILQHRDLIPKTHSTTQGFHSQNPFYNTGISFPKPILQHRDLIPKTHSTTETFSFTKPDPWHGYLIPNPHSTA